jgi:hypothetical protein
VTGDTERSDQPDLVKADPAPAPGDLRASDADRAAVAQRLQAAVDEGRLDLSDYDERLRVTYAARTYGELDRVTADLPAPAPAVVDVAAAKTVEKRREHLDEWRSWGGTAVVLVAIWGITSVASGGALFFWPMFPLGIWAAILLAGMVSGGSKGSC